MSIGLVAVDLLSSLAMMSVAIAFFALWRRSRSSLHLLFAFAFATLAAGMSTVSTSEFDLTGASPLVDTVRIVTHTAAPLMFALGYWSHRRERPIPTWRVVAISFGVATVLGLLVWAAPPTGSVSLGSTRNAFVAAHALQFVLYLGVVVLSSGSLLRAPSWRRALVPLGFLAYAFSKYSWILIDLSGDTGLIAFIYFWRFTMLALLLLALMGPFLRGDDHAAA